MTITRVSIYRIDYAEAGLFGSGQASEQSRPGFTTRDHLLRGILGGEPFALLCWPRG
jgi:hypothetical protein